MTRFPKILILVAIQDADKDKVIKTILKYRKDRKRRDIWRREDLRLPDR